MVPLSFHLHFRDKRYYSSMEIARVEIDHASHSIIFYIKRRLHLDWHGYGASGVPKDYTITS